MSWPRPNARGNYNWALAQRFSAGNERSLLEIYLLEIQEGWIIAHDYRFASDRWVAQLNTRQGVFRSESDALFHHLQLIAKELEIPPRLITGVKKAYRDSAQFDLFGDDVVPNPGLRR